MAKDRIAGKLAKFGSQQSGERRCIIIPTDKTKDFIKKFDGKDLIITIESVD